MICRRDTGLPIWIKAGAPPSSSALGTRWKRGFELNFLEHPRLNLLHRKSRKKSSECGSWGVAICGLRTGFRTFSSENQRAANSKGSFLLLFKISVQQIQRGLRRVRQRENRNLGWRIYSRKTKKRGNIFKKKTRFGGQHRSVIHRKTKMRQLFTKKPPNFN